MSDIQRMADAVVSMTEAIMNKHGNIIADDMKTRLQSAGHIDTGALYDSIRSETDRDSQTISTYIYADAQNPVNGAYYAEFIEHGTGAAHGRAGGRVGSWKYKDAHGNWHTTDGMDADPFIEPAVDADIGDWFEDLGVMINTDIDKYWRTVSGND